MEEVRREYLKRIRELLSDPEIWENLKEFIYAPCSLDVDVVVDDTTLREGLQMAGLMSPLPSEACRIACMLRDIGVERLEVLTYTKSDQDGIKLMRDEGLGPMLAAWCRAITGDVDIARKLDFEQVGISHPVSYIQLEKWATQPLHAFEERMVKTVRYAVEHGMTVFVHGEDSTRADWEFEKKFINAAAEAGASVYRICDTVGCGDPDPSAPLPRGIRTKIRHIKEETTIPHVEIHAHDDLGNASANTMAAIRAASRLYDKVYASTTFLGIGDRSGNAETEKVIMNCYFHHNVRKWDLAPLRELASLITSSTGYHMPVNKAIVGDGAFAHESGIHVHGIATLPITYEVFPPELVGQKRRIVVGKRSGKHGIRLKLEEMLGQKVDEDDPRFLKLLQIIREGFVKGRRRYPIEEKEFEEYSREVGFEVGGA